MHHSLIKYGFILMGLSGLAFSAAPVKNATVKNAGFDTYIAASDSFAGWTFTKNPAGYVISQETDSAHTPPGALKILNIDTSVTASITGAITGLVPNKIFTITAWVKYADMPIYYKAMFNLQQATMSAPNWDWVDREWLSPWGNNPGTSDWRQITMSDTTADSANIFNLVITSSKGTFWVDDITVTYTDLGVATNSAVTPAAQISFRNNRINFPQHTPYTLEASTIDGKMILRKTGIAGYLDLNRTVAGNGVYLVRVTTAEKTYTSRVVVAK